MNNDGWDDIEHMFILILVMHTLIIIALSFL